MNRLISRPWFFPLSGAILYLVGFNDAILHVIGSAWLSLHRSVQTIVVVLVLGLVAYLVNDAIQARRSAYRASVRAAAAIDNVQTQAQSTGGRS